VLCDLASGLFQILRLPFDEMAAPFNVADVRTPSARALMVE
jgi:hypothetical protein